MRTLPTPRHIEVDLDYVPEAMPPGHDYHVFQMASTVTQDSTIRGATSGTFYAMEPVKWFLNVMKAARIQQVMLPLVRQETLGPGAAQGVMTKELVDYADDPGGSDWEASSAEYTTANTDMLFSDIANEDGVVFEPDEENYGVALTNKAMRRNAVNQVESKSRVLRDRMSYVIDNAIYTAIRPASGGVQECTASARGVMTIFGGDATNAANSLDNGDILTPTVIRRAKRLLMSRTGWYWLTNVFKKSSAKKNPWMPGQDGPFYGIIKAESWEALAGNTQFTNAAEFGTDSVVKTGEIAKYLGINLAQSTVNASYASGENVYVQGANAAQDIDDHEVYFVKANYFAGLMWGQKPKLHVFDLPQRMQKVLAIEQAYQAKALYSDAIVRAIVADHE